MSEDFVDYLSPAQVATLLGIPPSTLRTYAAEFGRLLSRGAQGDPAVAGRAFRHRRYTRDDLKVLSQAKALVDDGLSYRLALAQLSGGGSVVDERRRPRGARSRAKPPATRKAGSSREASPAPSPPPVPDAVPSLRPQEVTPSEKKTEIVVDRAAAEAVERLRSVIERVVDGMEVLDGRLASLEVRLDALQMAIGNLDRMDSPRPVTEKHWIRRLFGRRE